MVLNRPRSESATKAPSIGKTAETPDQLLTILAAVAVGSWKTVVKYMMRLLDKPMKANCSATSTTVRNEKFVRKLRDPEKEKEV